MLSKVATIFAAAGLEYKETKYTRPPQSTYFVVFDHESLIGPDLCPGMLRQHDITIEAYEPRIDDASEAALEAAMTNALLDWTRSDREWIQTEQLYMVTYSFTYIEKRSINNA